MNNVCRIWVSWVYPDTAAIVPQSSESGDQASAGAGVPGWSWRQFLFGTTGGGTSAIPSEETGGIIEEIKICLAA